MSCEADALHKHAVPGKIIKEWIIPARGYDINRTIGIVATIWHFR